MEEEMLKEPGIVGKLAEVLDNLMVDHLIGGMIKAYGRINTGGEKVYPEEVEGILKRHPAVYRVGVTSLPDERWVEAVTAVIELHHEEKTTEEEIIEYCKGKMAGFKVPKHVLFIPKLAVGGVEKAIRPKVKYLAKAMHEEGKIPTEEELDEEWRRGKRI